MEYYLVRQWSASYYCWKSRAWKYGKLNLCTKYISFNEDCGESSSDSEMSKPIVTVDVRDITGFQRRLASFVYRSITVKVKDEKPLWFSSFQNREEVYYFLEHFWKERLLCIGPRSNKKRSSLPSSSTQADKHKVFEILYDCEETLVDASKSLSNQGEQLNNSSNTMNRMHKDLNVTDAIVNNMNRWFTKWNVKLENFYKIQTKCEYPILYRKTTKEYYHPGTLVFIEGQVTVLNISRVADVSILLKDLTDVIVHTPWNVILMHSAIGEIEVIIDISSAQVVSILKMLEKDHGDKFDYEDQANDGSMKTVKIPHFSTTEALVEEDFDTEDLMVDEADLDVVEEAIEDMKSLAVGINQEMTRQMDTLDQLSESVDKANSRIKINSRKIAKKL